MLTVSPTSPLEAPVPVTAKLSKRFYDVLGEDVANELVDWFNAVDLTYRADLRELNELNFARFDAKLEQRLAELRAELRREIAELRAELKQEIAELRQEIAELRQELIGSRGESRSGLHSLRADLIKWMFGFWVTTVLTLAGLIVALRG
jgi:hypothetical protein